MDEQKLRKALEDIFYLCHSGTARGDNEVRYQALEIAGAALEIPKPWTADEWDDLVEKQAASVGMVRPQTSEEYAALELALSAAALGKIGGASRSEAKQAASRINGTKGGRPKKS